MGWLSRSVCLLIVTLAVVPAIPGVAGAAPGDPLVKLAIAQAQLTADDGATSDTFGRAVAISGDTAVVGAGFDRVGTNNSQGSAYVFVRSGTTWVQQAHLTASDGAGDDWFGIAVAISGDTIVVGAGADDVGADAQQGSAYVFVRSGTTWTQQAKLTASDGAAGDTLGSSVAIFGDTVVAGADSDDVGLNAAQGSAYVFVRSGTTWTQQARLTASDGAAEDFFGFSVAISGDTAVVGANWDDIGSNNHQGSAYVFVRSGTTWAQQAKLTAGREGAAGDAFGNSVAVSGETAVIGIPYYGDSVGRAHVFVRSGTTWARQARLAAGDGSAVDKFGHSVSISGGTIVAGAHQNTVGDISGRGSAYVFMRNGSVWSQRARLLAKDGANTDYFGVAVGVSGSQAVVGAYLRDVGANPDQGAAYVFSGLVAPRIRTLSPTSGRVGTTVTITGMGFGATRGTSKVYFGSKAATRYVFWSASKIKVKVPSVTKGKKAVKVKTSLGPSNVKYFTRT
jgi:hypothetical protein